MVKFQNFDEDTLKVVHHMVKFQNFDEDTLKLAHHVPTFQFSACIILHDGYRKFQYNQMNRFFFF